MIYSDFRYYAIVFTLIFDTVISKQLLKNNKKRKRYQNLNIPIRHDFANYLNNLMVQGVDRYEFWLTMIKILPHDMTNEIEIVISHNVQLMNSDMQICGIEKVPMLNIGDIVIEKRTQYFLVTKFHYNKTGNEIIQLELSLCNKTGYIEGNAVFRKYIKNSAVMLRLK